MKRKTIIAWLGFLVIVTPFVAVPIQWKEYALIIFGVLIVIFSLAGGRRRGESRNAAYVENQAPVSEPPRRV